MSLSKGSIAFLQAVFGADWQARALLAVHSPASDQWLSIRAYNSANIREDDDVYWCIAAFPAQGGAERKLALADEVRSFVVDDVGTKVTEGETRLAYGEPTGVVETSVDNFQWSYRLAAPVPVGEWSGYFAGAEKLIGKKLEGRDAVHLFRLPQGRNNKKGRGKFEVKGTELNSGVQLSGIEPVPEPSGPVGPSGLDSTPVWDIRGLVALIKNPAELDRDEWIAIAHQIKALAEDETAGEEAFGDFSGRWEAGGYSDEDTERAWNSIPENVRTGGRSLKERAARDNPEGFERWVQVEAVKAFDDGAEPPEIPPGKGTVKFELGSKKEILRSRVNAEKGITGLNIIVTWDAFHHRMYIQHEGAAAERVTDHTIVRLRTELTNVYGKDFGTQVIWDAVISLALQNEFNPVCDMLAAAEAAWDGVKRLDRLGPDYFNTEDTEEARTCFRKTMLAAVRRARRPGCKFDQILVVESLEGWNKSSAWEVLAGRENFSDESIIGKNAREVQEQLADIWIHENPELAGLHKSDIETVKAFASRTNDRARPAYGRVLIDQPRQSIEVGTTNAKAYLLSPTGNRRFWPFALLKQIDLEKLRRDRLQLWGEAATAESAGETLVLPEPLWKIMGAAQEKRRAIDTWEVELEGLEEIAPGGLISGGQRINIRNGEQFITSASVQDYLGGYRGQHLHAGAGKKIAEIMQRLGWEGVHVRWDGKMTRGFIRARPTDVVHSGSVPGAENLF